MSFSIMILKFLYASICLVYYAILRLLGYKRAEWTVPLLEDVQQLSQLDEKTAYPAVKSARIPVKLPNLFSPTMDIVRDPPVNPYYEQVRLESEAWLAKAANCSQKMQIITHKINMSFFLAITVPKASPAKLRAMFDWGNWVFPYDDQFDDGIIKDPIEAQRMCDILLSTMDPTATSSESDAMPDIIRAHGDLWQRLKATSSGGVAQRYKECMHRYAKGVVEQVQLEAASKNGNGRSINITPEDMIVTRRRTVGAEPIFPLIEHALDIDLPPHIFDHWTIQEFHRVVIDLVIISNDIVSYRKEEEEGNPHNLVSICRRAGMGAQQAFDCVGAMLNARYHDWRIAFAALPSWGPEVDKQVQQYVEAVRLTAVGNMNWSFRSERYFGKSTEQVKATMITDVLSDEAFAASA